MVTRIVVVGTGYVGTTVAAKFAETGFEVTGIDIDEKKVIMINKGESPVKGDEPGLDELLRETVGKGKLKATLDYGECSKADVIIIAVETPFDTSIKRPYYMALRSAVTEVGQNMKKGCLIVIESTIAPGTMGKIVKPILEEESGLIAGKDFNLVNCPERVMPGRLLVNIVNYNRVIGGITKECAARAKKLYKEIVKGEIDITDCITAEIVKTTENAYRDVQIAFANEIALLCQGLGVNVHEVRELVNKCPFREMHVPGAGVGGHCIPKDSWLLAYGGGKRFEPRLIATAREINDSMPLEVGKLVEEAFESQGMRTWKKKITVLGLAYLENSDDVRNSPSLALIKYLMTSGATVTVHDPHVDIRENGNFELTCDLEKAVNDTSAIVIMTAHDEYRELDLDWVRKQMDNENKPMIIDGRNVFKKEDCEARGYIYRGIGK